MRLIITKHDFVSYNHINHGNIRQNDRFLLTQHNFFIKLFGPSYHGTKPKNFVVVRPINFLHVLFF